MADQISPQVTAVVFDFDGTLADSLAVKYEARFELFANEPENVRAVAAEVIPKIRGKLRGEIIRAILTETHGSLPAEEFEARVLDFSGRYDALVEDLIVRRGLFPGARETLDELTRFKLYVNSGTPEYALRSLLDRLQIAARFSGVYGVHPSRTEGAAAVKKENLGRILAGAGCPGENVLVVGDGTEDLASAEAYGCRFVGIASERNRWREQNKFPVIGGVAELLALPELGFNLDQV